MATIKLRRGTAVEWTEVNPILAAGEPGFEIDTGKEKRGDGFSTWSVLPYFEPGGLGGGEPGDIIIGDPASDFVADFEEALTT